MPFEASSVPNEPWIKRWEKNCRYAFWFLTATKPIKSLSERLKELQWEGKFLAFSSIPELRKFVDAARQNETTLPLVLIRSGWPNSEAKDALRLLSDHKIAEKIVILTRTFAGSEIDSFCVGADAVVDMPNNFSALRHVKTAIDYDFRSKISKQTLLYCRLHVLCVFYMIGFLIPLGAVLIIKDFF